MTALLNRAAKALLTAFFITILITLIVKLADPSFHYAELLARIFTWNFGNTRAFSEAATTYIYYFAGETLQRIVIAFLIAAVAGLVVAAASARWSLRTANGVSTILHCIPYVAIVLAFLAAYVYGKVPATWAAVLSVALYQIPAAVRFFSCTFAANGTASIGRVAHGVLSLFAEKLPGALGAMLLAEEFLLAHGESRSFIIAFHPFDLGQFVALLTIGTFFVLAVRFVATVLTPRTSIVLAEHGV